MMWEVKFTNVDEVIRDLEQIDEGRSLDSVALCDVVEWLKQEVDRDVVGGLTYEDLLFEIKNEIEDGNLNFSNTYNWCGKVTHDLCWTTYVYDGMCYIVMMIHRFGDVRCNYTDYIVLEYDDEYQFMESWIEVPMTVSGFETESGIYIRLWADPFGEWIQWTAEDDTRVLDGETADCWVADMIDDIEKEFLEYFED